MKILVGCEWSGTVRDALRRLGHNAWSNDIEGVEAEGEFKQFHLTGSVLNFLKGPPGGGKWSAALFFPPCTYLCNSGVRWLYGKNGGTKSKDPVRWKAMDDGARFFLKLWNAKIPKIAIENPVMHGHAKAIVGVSPSQIIQPWMFGHGETKATGLYLQNLPLLVPTKVVEGRHGAVHLASPGPDRGKIRGKTYSGIAAAMAQQWFGKAK